MPEQQCHLVTPFQLFFTYRAAFENGQVRFGLSSRPDSSSPVIGEEPVKAPEPPILWLTLTRLVGSRL